jgi:hypothetical protein
LSRAYLAAAVLVAIVGPPASAATLFYVAWNNKTHACEIVTHKPAGLLVQVVKTAFTSSAAATAAMKTAAACNP